MPKDGSSHGRLVPQQISRAELERARLDVRGEALRKTAARLQELASGAALALTAADSSLMQIDRDYTKLHAEVRQKFGLAVHLVSAEICMQYLGLPLLPRCVQATISAEPY